MKRLRFTSVALLAGLSWNALGCSAPEDGGSASFEGTQAGLTFSKTRGIYEAPFDLRVSHGSAKQVRYTLDGSDPRSSASAISAALPLSLHVDPADTAHRFLAPGYVVRATVGDATAPASSVVTHTYLFPSRVSELSPDGKSPGAGWPAPTTQGQVIDYGMDPQVTQSNDYATLVTPALTAIPSLSLVTELGNLFDQSKGIYENAKSDGAEWERFASIELINPDHSPGFQANSGVRIRGGYSRSDFNPKHSFRLFFRGEYGTAKLRFRLFGSEGTDSFDKVDLRTSQNYSWSMDGGAVDTMTREVFSRDMQGVLGRPYTRSRFYHLYLDGVYWGLYQTEERPEANFAVSYLGGDRGNYDVVKVNTEANDAIEATDGNLDAWKSVWQLTQAGFASDAAVLRLEGKNASGARDKALPVLVDVDNLIDYMLITFYTANFDGPVSKWFSNQRPNNFYALRSRADDSRGFVFIAHDCEHSMMADPITITAGVTENRVNIGQSGGAVDGSGKPSDAYRMNITDFNFFQPQWLHQKLSENGGYRKRFAARAHALLEGNGALTAGPAAALFQKRISEIQDAVVAESARWGDAKQGQPRTKNQDWTPAVKRVLEGFIAKRTPIVIQQLTAAGLY
ncbi:MAG: CotH kinase family protein [Polyangiaceae bacterium]